MNPFTAQDQTLMLTECIFCPLGKHSQVLFKSVIITKSSWQKQTRSVWGLGLSIITGSRFHLKIVGSVLQIKNENFESEIAVSRYYNKRTIKNKLFS